MICIYMSKSDGRLCLQYETPENKKYTLNPTFVPVTQGTYSVRNWKLSLMIFDRTSILDHIFFHHTSLKHVVVVLFLLRHP